MNEGRTKACGSCGEAAPLSADLCPLCEGPTGFGWGDRLGKAGKGAIAAGVLGLWVGAYFVGVARGKSALEETSQVVSSDAEVSPEQIEQQRAAETSRIEGLKREIAGLEEQLAAQGPAAEELARLQAELEALPTRKDVAQARRARETELRKLFPKRRR